MIDDAASSALAARLDALGRTGLDAVLQVDIHTADTESSWQFRIAAGEAELSQGTPWTPSVIVEARAEDLAALMDGTLRADAAIVDGRLQIAGDVALAMKLAPVLLGEDGA